MSTVKSKQIRTTALSLICVIAAGIALNIIGGRLNTMLGMPLYIDSIGTILSALCGGYIPCITVGFLSNIFVGFTDSYTTYYCVISVFIAVAAVRLYEKKKLESVPGVILSVAVFALIGGFFGSILTWLINGFTFGDGVLVTAAEKLNKLVPMGYFASNIVVNFLSDIVDKLIVTVTAIIIYRLLPSRLKQFLSRQSWHNLVVMNKAEKKGKVKVPIRIKVALVVAMSTTLVAVGAVTLSILQYHNSVISDFTEEGVYATRVIADKLDKTRIDAYLKEGRSAEGYAEAEDMMYTIRDSSPDIRFIYVYRIEPDGTHVVFDLDDEEVKPASAGEVIPYDKTITKYRDKLVAGEDIPVDITDDVYGWVLSVYRPLRDSSGKTLCYVGADMSMERLRLVEFTFLAKFISVFIGFLIMIRTFAIWSAERSIIKPINTMTDAALNFSYDTPESREKSMEMIKNINAQTGDEIENLYDAYRKMTSDTVKYINESQAKSEQISKMQNGIILVLADLVESRDKCTGDHVRKTAAYTEIILNQMKKDGIYADRLTDEYIAEVVNSAPLHDVGKIAVSDAILNKPGKLTDEEFALMRGHAGAGGEIIDKAIALVDVESEYLNEAKNLARYHHEKWNGEGYPTRLSGEDIPLSARVMAVADVFDALVSQRSYKKAFSIETALDIIREGSGSHFDPQIVKAFLEAEEQVRKVADMNIDIKPGDNDE